MVDNIISSLGAGSGIDTIKLVDQLVEIEQAPQKARLDSREELLSAQLSDYGLLRSALSTLEDAVAALGNTETFDAKSLSFPETNLLTPTKLESKAQPGDYQIEVNEIARSQSLSSGLFASASAAVGEGTLTIRFGSWDDALTTFTPDANKTGGTITIDASNNTLSGLRNAINDADLGVQASVVADGDSFRLLITAPSGASNELEIVVEEAGGAATNNDNSDLSRFAFNEGGSQLTEQQAGLDAQLKINGLSVSRSSNTIDDVIEGLTFTVQNKSDTEVVSLSIAEDKSVAEQTIRDFVDAYNTFLETVGKLTGYDEEKEDFGSLRSDPLAKNMITRLRRVIGAAIPGIESGYSALTNVGIRTERDGSISIDQTENEKDFRTALDENYDLVKALFTPRISSDSALINVTGYSAQSKPGTYAVNVSHNATQGVLTGAAMIGFPLDTTGKDYSFVISVDGVTSATLTLPDATIYNTWSELATDLQTRINSDATLVAAGAQVAVSFDTDHFTFTSNSLGSDSKVAITEAGADLADLGLSVANGTPGTNVVGTINGKQGFGVGNVLLPALKSDAEGLSMIIGPGATTGNISYSRGFASEMKLIVDDFLKSTGLIKERETRINDDLRDVEDDRETLERRISAFRARLEAQFIAMERIVQSLQTSGDFFDGIADRLPFTARND